MIQIVESATPTNIISTTFDGGAKGKVYDGKMVPTANPSYVATGTPFCNIVECLNLDELAVVLKQFYIQSTERIKLEEKYTNYGKSSIWYPCDQDKDASGCSGPYDDLTCGKRIITKGSGADVEGVM